MVDVTNQTRSTLPKVPFELIKDKILGRQYDLSVVFVGETKIRALNFAHRAKDKATDILSFPLDKSTGEIFICPTYIKAHMSKYAEYAPKDRLSTFIFLFIHGLLHLKGLDHGSTMEREERKFMRLFTHEKSTSRRH